MSKRGVPAFASATTVVCGILLVAISTPPRDGNEVTPDELHRFVVAEPVLRSPSTTLSACSNARRPTSYVASPAPVLIDISIRHIRPDRTRG
jgi:hypothetical protein